MINSQSNKLSNSLQHQTQTELAPFSKVLLSASSSIIINFLFRGVNIDQINKSALIKLYSKEMSNYRYPFKTILLMEWFVLNNRYDRLANFLEDIIETFDMATIPQPEYVNEINLFMPGFSNRIESNYLKEQLEIVFGGVSVEIIDDLSMISKFKIANVDNHSLIFTKDNREIFLAWVHLNQLLKKGMMHQEIIELVNKVKQSTFYKKLLLSDDFLILEQTLIDYEKRIQSENLFRHKLFHNTSFNNMTISLASVADGNCFNPI